MKYKIPINYTKSGTEIDVFNSNGDNKFKYLDGNYTALNNSCNDFKLEAKQNITKLENEVKALKTQKNKKIVCDKINLDLGNNKTIQLDSNCRLEDDVARLLQTVKTTNLNLETLVKNLPSTKQTNAKLDDTTKSTKTNFGMAIGGDIVPAVALVYAGYRGIKYLRNKLFGKTKVEQSPQAENISNKKDNVLISEASHIEKQQFDIALNIELEKQSKSFIKEEEKEPSKLPRITTRNKGLGFQQLSRKNNSNLMSFSSPDDEKKRPMTAEGRLDRSLAKEQEKVSFQERLEQSFSEEEKSEHII